MRASPAETHRVVARRLAACLGVFAAVAALSGAPALRADAPLIVAGGAGDQRAPALARGEGGFLAVWETCADCERTGADLAARALDADGKPTGAVVALDTSPADTRAPAVSYNADRDEYLVVWSGRYPGSTDHFRVEAMRVAPDGTPRGTRMAVAEVTGVWPGAVVSSRGAWSGYDVAWAAQGPAPDGLVTVIHTRHLDADGVPDAEVWALSDADYEALGPRAIRGSGGAGAMVAWFAYRAGTADERPRLLGARIGLSGRPIGAARPLVDGAVCAAALTEHVDRPELMLATIGCDVPSGETSGALRLTRLGRAGDTVGEPFARGDTVPARDLGIAATSGGDYVLVAPIAAGTADDPVGLAQWRFDADAEPRAPPSRLGDGGDPAVAGDATDGAVVLAAVEGDGIDIVTWRIVPIAPASATPATYATTPTAPASVTPVPTMTPVASPAATEDRPVTVTPEPTAGASMSSTAAATHPPASSTPAGHDVCYIPLTQK